ncbi:MAG: hypothetical protein Kow0022_16060 [Phycisphaerales bacterium]
MAARLVRALSLILALTASLLLSAGASAQTRIAVVKESGAVMRSGDMPRFYRVADLAPGTFVDVLAEADGWSQVVYPEGLNVYVEASKVRKIDDRTLELTEPSALLAPSALLGASGSWCALYDKPLPAGTRLELIEAAVGFNQKVTKYLVRPPADRPARGFVRSDELRNPTPAELAAHRAQMPAPASQTEPAPEPKPKAEPMPQSEPAPAERSPAKIAYEGVDASLLSPMVTGPLPPVQGSPADVLAVDGGGPSDGSVSKPDLTTLTLVQLNTAFEELRALPRDRMDAGLEELLAECRRAVTKVADDPELVEAINQRIQWLELRIRLRDQRRQIEQTLAQADQRTSELSEKVRAWQSSRSYTLIGRVAPSTLYDGKRLPLMYRVESLDGPGFQRTIGYLRPPEGENYERYVGAVVGVIGQTAFDDALGVRIIKPERIDLMENR